MGFSRRRPTLEVGRPTEWIDQASCDRLAIGGIHAVVHADSPCYQVDDKPVPASSVKLDFLRSTQQPLPGEAWLPWGVRVQSTPARALSGLLRNLAATLPPFRGTATPDRAETSGDRFRRPGKPRMRDWGSRPVLAETVPMRRPHGSDLPPARPWPGQAENASRGDPVPEYGRRNVSRSTPPVVGSVLESRKRAPGAIVLICRV